MSCCQDAYRPAQGRLGRRELLQGAAGVAALGLVRPARSAERVRLAFCSQLLCVVPYEFTRASGHFEAEGLEVELVYTRGGNAAMQALVGGAVDYAATSFDVAVQAFANGAPIRRFATTGRLPLFALAVAPAFAGQVTALADLEGRRVGVSALGNADHTLLLFLLKRAGVDAARIEFAVLGPNLFEALRRGQVAAGMVQEPALTLIRESGGRVLFNAMDMDQARALFGGPYEFMGVAYRAEERAERLDQMQRLARALEQGLRGLRRVPPRRLREALPRELLVGGDPALFERVVGTYRASLYPETVAIDVEACARVVEALTLSGALTRKVELAQLLDLEVVG